ncbi:protein of unknown function UPF0182 [Desulfofarcimen acetoxidans DSM 771]|uniref:UPF0182 protein Dtox_2146 n=1 Tax=Desulfofarcimen acetoxidans (strain ATCC 49208 / DSM 771 / KCTC 5769 / VKM B-1644 / 5575) TaxID=485916 RepID=C8VZ63_DESAS|nr:UPF0182 family protein [Desulfofarcimen acetoxidans]ACV62973.1 protein of unknown function UPF0182 [Desulfofarcimen acetoxidans DSM 771]
MRFRSRIVLGVILGVIVFIIAALKWGIGLYTDWLWFKSLHYQRVFLTILLTEVGLRIAVGITFFVFFFANLLIVRKPVLEAINNRQSVQDGDVITFYRSPLADHVTPKRLTLVILAFSLLVSFFMSYSVTGDWLTLQKFLQATPFNETDPIFNNDISFYVFSLPFYRFLYGLFVSSVLITGFFAAVVYFLTDRTPGGFTKLFRTETARYHLSFLAAIYFIIKAWGYQLNEYLLLFSNQRTVFGPGYTDIHANLFGLKILVVISLITALAILVNIFLKKFRLVLYSIGFLIVSSIVLGGIYPAAIQNFIVKPNEFEKEKQYIEHNIALTKKAYRLEDIERKDFPAGGILKAEDIQNNRDVIDNIRLWDYRPLQQTYGQMQTMRLYYEFKNIDIDRYTVNGQYRQVMLAPRELNQSQLMVTAKTWVNQRLQYTHGYGVAMSAVNKVTSEGLPEFLIKDIPPVTKFPELQIKRPEIYFGESEDNYVIVNTKTQEFDHPKGEDNVYSTYEAKNGVKIGNFLNRLIFAFSFSDYKLLLASNITSDSQILFHRNIQDRVSRIAPFLKYDKDPYIVLSSGKLYWMWDAYTLSNMYPYSEPFGEGNNYIRNSVKVVVDAYTGEVTYYVSDSKDPIINTYSKIFPGVFLPLENMPADLYSHIRYPEDLFIIQAEKYALYHMNNPLVFYNKEDKWDLPTEIFGSDEQAMEPYYTITRLPGEKKPEYTLIMPFTPQNKKNMVAWMVARSDGENYGKTLVYEFPKQELVYGPMLIEARINQDTTISQQLALWDQRGSSIIRGNLLVIPIKDSLLYVEPLYLQAKQSKMPELRRVIVALGDQVVMEPTLDMALKRIFGAAGITSASEENPASENQVLSVSELIKQANSLYDAAQAKLKAGDWAGYGESIKQLKEVLNNLTVQATK